MFPSGIVAWMQCWIFYPYRNQCRQHRERIVNKLYFNWHQLTRLRNFSLIWFGWLCLHTNALALPFGVYDTRTMAMGGVGVATGHRNAVFNNPALLTTADEIHEWALILPTVGRQLDDSDDLKDNLDKFKQAADTLDASPGAANVNAVQATLDAIDGSQYRKTNNVAFMLAIPSRILSGAVFLNSYEISNVKPIIGGDDLTIPTYNSTLAHRGVRIIENGVSAAKILDAEDGWMENLAIGFNAKFLLIKTYGYTEALRTADLGISGATGNNSSQFALDVGALKEFGVWKVALVAKNILSGEYTYGSSNDVMKIDPQLRAGFAYKSRWSVLELNVDLTKNDPIGFDTPSQLAAIGWEWKPWDSLAVRAGYYKNLVESETNSKSSGVPSLGIGLVISGFHIDVAGYTGDEGNGVSGQLGLQF